MIVWQDTSHMDTNQQKLSEDINTEFIAPNPVGANMPGGVITVFVIFAVVVTVGLFILIDRFEDEQHRNSLLRTAEEMSRSISNFRQFYSQEIVAKLKESDTRITHDYKTLENAIPLPATMTIEFGKFLEQKGSGSSSRLYSKKPFPWRIDRTIDNFGSVALKLLSNTDEKSFYRLETIHGKEYLRYATPVVMLDSCVDCHNQHPESPFNEWKTGDVRGIQEILIERGSESIFPAYKNGAFKDIVIFISTAFSIALAFIFILVKRNSRAFIDLKHLANLEKSERRQVVTAMDRVKEGLARHQAVLNGANEGIITIDENGDIETVNPAVEKIFGFSSGELQGRNLDFLIPPKHSTSNNSYLADYHRTGHNKIIGKDREVIGIRKDGLEFPMELSVSEVNFGDRRLFTGIVRDITERKRAEQALRDSEAQARQLSMVASRTDNAVIFADKQGYIEWVNDGFTRISGYTLDEVKGKTPGSVLQGPDTDQEVVKKMSTAIKSGQSFQEEILNYNKNGDPYWVSIEAQTILDEKGELVQFMAIERNITQDKAHKQELEQARIKAEEANNAKSRFLAMMSHEIRTPLNGVIGTLGLLHETRLTNKQKKFVETGRYSAENLLTIINDILSFSKLEAGKDELEISLFEMRSLVESVKEVLSTKAYEKPITLTTIIDANVPEYLEGDAGKIRQVLLNLASNAVKFTDRGEVRIEASLSTDDTGEKNRLQFTVTDTGVGISSEDQENLFDEFWTMSPNYHTTGTGLGLAISRNLVELMSGHIEMTSSQGKGSCFWFEIPVQVPSDDTISNAIASKTSEDESSNADHINLKGRILLAEDNPANQMIGVAMLKNFGLQVDTVGNGLEAVEAVQARPYDIVLMDIGMPEMDGIEATQHIRRLKGRPSKIPVIAMTAHVMKGDREKILSQGLDDYISKPVNRTELLACLKSWLIPTSNQMNARVVSSSSSNSTAVEETTLDFNKLEQLFNDTNHEITPALVDAFLNEMKVRLENILHARNMNDLGEITHESHALKSCAASYGANRLSSLAAKLELAGRNNATREAMDIVNSMPTVIESTREALITYVSADDSIEIA
ncbi:MAG: PAS domain S-box protein [Gammaproteobacteria bacterium]|nr:MAG: PAS domain S-box protein [Gammaproteobacteria bacterium]